MKVTIAEKCGFCRGVNVAIELARKTLSKGEKVYSLGPIIHNEDVVNELLKAGLVTVSDVNEINSGTVLIRSHGATLKQLRRIEEKGLKIVDATCVLVKRVQKLCQTLSVEGYKIVIIGDETHPEVKAIVGFGEDVVVIGSKADLCRLGEHGKLGVISQTTQSPGYFAEMVGEIIKRGFSELKVVNTLCREAIRRQDSAVKLCKEVDIMFVLGGLHSSNTRKLAELCKKHNTQTFHLQNWQELDKTVLRGRSCAGVTAGASTPEWVINDFVEQLRAF